MDFKVIFEDSFIEDLGRIVRLIAIHNPTAARNLGEQIIRVAESLKFFPERYPRVRQRMEVRRFIVKKNFKVFFRIQYQIKVVQILRCWDGRRGTDPTL
jgi:plasmid stabilization system protein ParE